MLIIKAIGSIGLAALFPISITTPHYSNKLKTLVSYLLLIYNHLRIFIPCFFVIELQSSKSKHFEFLNDPLSSLYFEQCKEPFNQITQIVSVSGIDYLVMSSHVPQLLHLEQNRFDSIMVEVI
jgi:hypothetical protein